ncbi:MAG TPA: TonB-dependent receptor [Thermoanaerobaculia bacterium]|nr:TonB-dependent receptor [Thermoanaerobaculia bacterium]
MVRHRALALVILLFLTTAAFAQSTGSITGTVYNSQAVVVTDATVTLVELRRSVRVGDDGTFAFTNLRPGHYHVRAESPREGSATGDIEVGAGETRTLEIVVDRAVHAEQIVVTASPDTRVASEVYQPVNVLGQEEIARRLQPTLGETLKQEPGVDATYFGPGSSRPVIRGLGADRIRILQEGVGTGDVSNVSPDHAVSVDPANAEQIEIVRGPATLLYGSNAVGGVVNVIDERIPSRVPAQAVTGNVDLRLGSVADERTGSFNLTGGQGQFAWHAGFLRRRTGDYQIPGPADEHDEDVGRTALENSALSTQSGSLGGSWIGERGFFGLAVSQFKTDYGVPGHHHHDEGEDDEEEEEEEEGVRIDLRQRRIDLKGALTSLDGFFRNVRLRVGHNDYEHRELEGTEVGTLFLSNGLEGRIEASHRPIGPLRGAFGVQLLRNEFEAVGEEAFVPPNETVAQAVFAFEEMTVGSVDFQFGARYEHQDVSTTAEDLPDRSFAGLSGSIGAIFRPAPQYNIAVSIARAVRLPTATELYANGPHAATRQFEIGDPNLDEERSLGIDVSLRKTAGRMNGQINFFNNEFSGYIFETPTGEEEDDLPVFRFIQADARFRGMELDTHIELWHRDRQHVELEAGADFVRATLSGGGNLPRIPPMRFRAGLRYEAGPFSGLAEAQRYRRQNRVADREEPTDGYTLVNAMLGYRFFAGNTIHDVMLRGTNLTDVLARSHISPLKEIAPLPGRDFSLSYRLTF